MPTTMSVLASLLSFAVLATPAAVEPRAPVSLSWQAPSECGDREQALVRLRELIPELPEQVPEQQGAIAVAVEITGTTAYVRFVSPRGTDERRLDGQTCAMVAKAVVVVIAVATEAEIPAAVPAEVPEPEQPVKALAIAPPIAPEDEPEQPLEASFEQPRSPTPPKPRIRAHVGLLGGGGFGPIDAGMGAVVLELGAHGPRWRASARGLWIPPRTIALADDDQLIGRYDGGFGGARACLVSAIARERIELPLCAGFEAGVLRGRGVSPTPAPDTATQPWAAIELGPGLRYVPTRWLALGVEVELVAGLLRGGFTLGETVARLQAPLGVRALAGIELRFPGTLRHEDPQSRP